MTRKRYTGVWNGLWHRKHHEKLGTAWMLFGYLLSRVNKQGVVVISYKDISVATGTPARTLQFWMAILKLEGYVEVRKSRSMVIEIQKFRSLNAARPCGTDPDNTPQDVAAPAKVEPQDLAGLYRNSLRHVVPDVAAPDSVNDQNQMGSANSLNIINKDKNVLRPSLPDQESSLSLDTL